MKWLPLINERVVQAETRPLMFWGADVPLVAAFCGLFWIPAIRARTGIDPGLVMIPVAAHLLMYGSIVVSKAGSRLPRLSSTLAAVVNLAAATTIPALSGRPGTLWWGTYFIYGLVSAVACGQSLLFLIMLVSAPLLVGVIWQITEVVSLANSLGHILAVDGLALVGYLVVSSKTEEREAMRGQLSEAERVAVVAKERARIAGELHDSLGASLTEVARWLDLCSVAQSGQRHSHMQRAARRIEEALADLRACVATFSGKRTSVLLLEGMIRSSAAGSCDAAGAHFELQVEGEAEGLSMMDARHISLVVAEATNNSLRHGAAHRLAASVRVGHDPRIVVEDDGQGFDPSTVTSGMGLRSIRDRARALGLAARFEPLPGRGMRLIVDKAEARS